MQLYITLGVPVQTLEQLIFHVSDQLAGRRKNEDRDLKRISLVSLNFIQLRCGKGYLLVIYFRAKSSGNLLRSTSATIVG